MLRIQIDEQHIEKRKKQTSYLCACYAPHRMASTQRGTCNYLFKIILFFFAMHSFWRILYVTYKQNRKQPRPSIGDRERQRDSDYPVYHFCMATLCSAPAASQPRQNEKKNIIRYAGIHIKKHK